MDGNLGLFITDLPIQDKVPGLPTKCISNANFNRIKQQVNNDVVEPNNSCPTPAYAFDSSEVPVCLCS